MSAKINVNSESSKAAGGGKETVYVDVEDEITSIIDKVDASKSKIVALVLPKRAATLQSVVNMRLLKRSADNAGKSVVLITGENALLPLAGAVGLYVAKTLQSKPQIPPSPIAPAADEVPVQSDDESVMSEDDELDNQPKKIDYNRSIGELAAAHEVESDEPDVITLDDNEELPEPKVPKGAPKPPKEKKPKVSVPNFDRFRLLLFGGIAAVLALIIFLFMAVFVLPKAQITIQTSADPISANLSLNASDKYTVLNEDANQIPASLKATNQTSQQTVNASGQQNQGNKASGTVKLTNCTDSAVTIPAGTGVSSNSLTYITQTSLTLNSGNFTSSHTCKTTGDHVGTVNVIAQKGGSSYNLPANSTFNVAGFSGVTGTNTAAFSGGTDNNVTVVSQADVDSARAKVTSQSADDFTNKFLAQLDQSGLYVLKSTLKVGDPKVTPTPAVGQPASSVSVSVEITYTVLTVKKDDLKKVITDTLNEQIDKSKQKIESNDVVKEASVSVQNQTGDAAATLTVSETSAAVPIINPGTVKKLAAGKKKADIQGPISGWPGVKNVEVKLSPFWVSKAPKSQNKINVVLQGVKS